MNSQCLHSSTFRRGITGINVEERKIEMNREWIEEKNLKIRKSRPEDEDTIMAIFALARDYMIAHGNKMQWTDGYPGKEVLHEDVLSGNNYVFEKRGKIVGTFTFIIGAEPTYQRIENGAWHSDKPYGTIHRLASDGTARGLARACFSFCSDRIDYLRIDTHMDNLTMQRAIESFGFQKCGTIFVRNGAERIAYDYRKEGL